MVLDVLAKLPQTRHHASMRELTHFGCWLLISHSGRTFGSDFYEDFASANYSNTFYNLLLVRDSHWLLLSHLYEVLLGARSQRPVLLVLSQSYFFPVYCFRELGWHCPRRLTPFRALRPPYSECLLHLHTELSMAVPSASKCVLVYLPGCRSLIQRGFQTGTIRILKYARLLCVLDAL